MCCYRAFCWACFFLSVVHADHEHPDADGYTFIHKLFEQYTHASDKDILTLSNFEAFLKKLAHPHTTCVSDGCCVPHLDRERNIARSEKLAAHKSTSSVDEHSSSPSTRMKDSLANSDVQTFLLSSQNSTSDFNVSATKEKCFGIVSLLTRFKHISKDDSIKYLDFYQLCPAILYHISSCREEDSKEHSHEVIENEYMPSRVWIYASVSVFAISLIGFATVFVIPLLQKKLSHRTYHTLLQFLVALAVGSLSGDALLHLLPHSLVSGETHEHLEKDIEHHHESIWKGFTALLAIYFFIGIERLMNLFSNDRNTKQRTKVLRSTKNIAKSLTTVDGEQSKVVGEKLSHHKHDSYGYKFDVSPETVEVLERLTEPAGDEKLSGKPIQCGGCCESENVSLNAKGAECRSEHAVELTKIFKGKNGATCMSEAENVIKESMEKIDQLHVDATCIPTEREQENPSDECHRETVIYRHATDDHSYVVTVTDHHHHNHGHHHGQSHNIHAVSSVAYMVVMGDGLHNFCDGMAIGAAFASGISGGLSTAVAVLCHELPHELGDFAMLLKAGVSVKQAAVYNIVSSVLCFMGTLIGVFLGNIRSVTSYVSSGASGMFIYIALVDMLPELSGGRNSCRQVFAQILGSAAGISIMLMIAIYEHELHHLFS